MSRPYFKHSVEELEQFLRRHVNDPAVLGDLLTELTYRSTERAHQLRREVEGLLSGTVPMPLKPARPARPEDQYPLLGE